MQILDTRPAIGLTRTEAHRVLSEAREGLPVRESVIAWCLYVTGDADRPAYRPQAVDDLERRFEAAALRRFAAGVLRIDVHVQVGRIPLSVPGRQ